MPPSVFYRGSEPVWTLPRVAVSTSCYKLAGVHHPQRGIVTAWSTLLNVHEEQPFAEPNGQFAAK